MNNLQFVNILFLFIISLLICKTCFTYIESHANVRIDPNNPNTPLDDNVHLCEGGSSSNFTGCHIHGDQDPNNPSEREGRIGDWDESTMLGTCTGGPLDGETTTEQQCLDARDSAGSLLGQRTWSRNTINARRGHENIDCVGSWGGCKGPDAGHSECYRDFNIVVPPQGNGESCDVWRDNNPHNNPCTPGEDWDENTGLGCPPDVDCVVQHNPCNVNCERAPSTTITPQSGNGDQCESPPPCNPGDDECPVPVDCLGGWSICLPQPDRTCARTFSISQPAEHGGTPCSHENGATSSDDCIIGSNNVVTGASCVWDPESSWVWAPNVDFDCDQTCESEGLFCESGNWGVNLGTELERIGAEPTTINSGTIPTGSTSSRTADQQSAAGSGTCANQSNEQDGSDLGFSPAIEIGGTGDGDCFIANSSSSNSDIINNSSNNNVLLGYSYCNDGTATTQDELDQGDRISMTFDGKKYRRLCKCWDQIRDIDCVLETESQARNRCTDECSNVTQNILIPAYGDGECNPQTYECRIDDGECGSNSSITPNRDCVVETADEARARMMAENNCEGVHPNCPRSIREIVEEASGTGTCPPPGTPGRGIVGCRIGDGECVAGNTTVVATPTSLQSVMSMVNAQLSSGSGTSGGVIRPNIFGSMFGSSGSARSASTSLVSTSRSIGQMLSLGSGSSGGGIGAVFGSVFGGSTTTSRSTGRSTSRSGVGSLFGFR